MSKKTAKKTVKKVAPKQQEQSTEQLALMLNQNYAQIMQAQQNIQAINKELERRQNSKEQ